MTEKQVRGFDADNHYYEALDAFTRHIEPQFAKRCMQWAIIDGRTRLLVGGKINRYLANPTFDKVADPGCLEEFFRGFNPSGKQVIELFGDLEPPRPAYRDRDARLAVLDEQHLGARHAQHPAADEGSLGFCPRRHRDPSTALASSLRSG